MQFDPTVSPRLVIFEASDGSSIDAVNIYSEAVSWSHTGAGGGYIFPFRAVGGDPAGDAEVSPYIFMAPGWRLQAQGGFEQVQVLGNIYREVGSTEPLVQPVAGATTVVTFERSVRSETRVVSGAGATPSENAAAVWARAVAAHAGADGTFGADLGAVPAVLAELQAILRELRNFRGLGSAAVTAAMGTRNPVTGTRTGTMTADGVTVDISETVDPVDGSESSSLQRRP